MTRIVIYVNRKTFRESVFVVGGPRVTLSSLVLVRVSIRNFNLDTVQLDDVESSD